MKEPIIDTVTALLEQITLWPVGMPVRAMEKVLSMGEVTVPAVTDALVRWQDDEMRDPLWLIVLLGELRSPASIELLITQMRRTEYEPLALAATEALAKIGGPAVPALREVITSSDPLVRLYAYASLGWIHDDQAYTILVEALSRDHELGDTLALALREQERLDTVPLLYQAYLTCEPWFRIEFENAIQELQWHPLSHPLYTKDWRLRYRRLPGWGCFNLGWTGICALLHRNAPLSNRPEIPLRSLEEILKDEPKQSAETCSNCKAPIEYPTGLPVCPETALAAALHQLRVLNTARKEGFDDLFDMLDDIDGQEEELQAQRNRQSRPLRRGAKKRGQDTQDELQIRRQICQWLIEQGTEQIASAKALLLAKAAELSSRYGDPEGLLQPMPPPRITNPKVGRNDPCPCGSGKKYKRCCLGSMQ